MNTKLLSFGKLDIGYFMENSSALNGNVPDANSPINFKNDSFCPASSRDFSILGNKSIMSLISIDSESHWGISFPEGQQQKYTKE
jgi:hypothetical protein